MDLRGRRIHIAGSADPECAEEKLQFAHLLVTKLSVELASRGGLFLVPFGREPLLTGRTDSPSITFDWTVAESVFSELTNGIASPSCTNGRLVATVATSKTDSQVPSHRRSIYEGLRQSDAVEVEFIEPGWSSGSVRRSRMARRGDILIGISGGEGVEHLALEYSAQGKPVIPLNLDLGSSGCDGRGGASRLFDRALASPSEFFKVVENSSAQDLLDRTRIRTGGTTVDQAVAAIIRLLEDLNAPEVFYVRLLNDSLPEFRSVERFFRKTVDPFITSLGYAPIEMGAGPNEYAWMNEAIFDSLHHSSIALVDLTALRPNCFMELGYSLGQCQRVILCARDDTKFPFDAFALNAYLWSEEDSDTARQKKLRVHWKRNIGTPPLVKERQAK